MSQDAYSPITGRWGVEGYWDVFFISIATVLLALVILVLARAPRERWLALVAAPALMAVWVGINWLGNVSIPDFDGSRIDCLMTGPVDRLDPCGEVYLERYFTLMVPLALALVVALLVCARQVRSRLRGSRLESA